ncbi:MAG: aminotransferase class I/II-fold pyridoxal phosphate-dependent enzyme [Desulfurococcaceae archaeon]|nr:aminotransferase class I/II-fold pyridoxal phosphate-dependent enzyme [Desulfurococcaceae archaeon]
MCDVSEPSLPEALRQILFGEVLSGLPVFCLERWQSLHETSARVLLSDSGVHPLSIAELSDYGLSLDQLSRVELGYGWTKGSPKLRERISEIYGGSVGPENVLVTNGSAEANLLTVLGLVRSSDLVLVDVPNYMQIPGLLKWLGARVIFLRRNPPDWSFPIDDAISLMRQHKPKAMFVNDPNNPTGTYMTGRELEELSYEAEKTGTTLVFDEVYWGSELQEPRPSVLEIASSGQAVSVSGLSKVYGLPGLRVGWVAGSEKLISRLWSLKDYTTIAPSILSDHIASVMLERDNVKRLRERAKSIVRGNLEILEGAYSEAGDLFEVVWPSAGAYFLARIPWSDDTLMIAHELFREYGVLVNPGECFEIPGYLRVGLGQQPTQFRDSLRTLVNGLEGIREKTSW